MTRHPIQAVHYWTELLGTPGTAPLPRWTTDPRESTAQLDHLLPDPLVCDLSRLSADTGVSTDAILLAAHAKVVSLLTGEPDVTIGLVPHPGGEPVPCRLHVVDGSWRDLLESAKTAEAHLRSNLGVPVGRLRRRLGLRQPFESVLDPFLGTDRDLVDGVVLWISLRPAERGAGLRVQYHQAVADASYAGRLAGYHVSALSAMAAHPDRRHAEADLLSAAERRYQLQELMGPRRPRPERPVHELFEARVRLHPDRVAAVQGDSTLTYQQLNTRANRLARTLVDRGLQPEEVVAVVTDRHLDWLVAVLAVFKAGGAYLPVEPHFPARRISTTLRRSNCRRVITEPGSRTALDQACADVGDGVDVLTVDEVSPATGAEADLDRPVSGNHLAYIYFTSGSTGEPKGAMCEHDGLVNHLFAKIEDLRIRDGDVVAQVAPQCFDISLWQLLAALLVGGRTHIVEQDVVLDVARFVDLLADSRVNVVQVVPSYLEVVLSYLRQQPRCLPALRFVSATGEALKKELVERWFATLPGVGLLNAYGLTETSDDTNHEVMHAPPQADRVPLGAPIANVAQYVVDDHLGLLPLGAPGLVAFSGVCVGRGYVNDPEQTALAYHDDPHRPGQRLYRGGDYARWTAEGKLEFLGRRDNQVKISGFRIELGDVENALLTAPGVRDAAVVVGQGPDGAACLVAYYAAESAWDRAELRARMARSVPHYMIPARLHWLPELPLTANGKIDRKALTERAATLGQPAADAATMGGPAADAAALDTARPGGPGPVGLVPDPAAPDSPAPDPAGPTSIAPDPAGPTSIAPDSVAPTWAPAERGDRAATSPLVASERRVAEAWSRVLGVPPGQLGRDDHFFERGGSSLAAVKLVLALGRSLSLRDILAHPVLGEMAALVDTAGREAGAGHPEDPT